ncbi:MAG TPA: glycosyltransferase family 39 protein [Anaerolineae bacterium]|nr:glycosyltransferase family 39 protein [Anaerolineae bacterium]
MLNLAYLFDPRPGPLPSHDLQLVIALMAVLVLGLGASMHLILTRRAVGPAQWLLLGQIPLSGCTLLLMSARLFNIPYLSTRVVLYGMAALSTLAWAVFLFRGAHLTGLLRRQMGLLTFSWEDLKPPTPASASLVLLTGHLLGLVFLAVQLGRSYISLVVLLVLLGSPQLLGSLRARRWRAHLEALSPLYFAYLAAVARRVGAKLLSRPLPLYDGFAYPEALSSFLNVEAILLASVVYVLLCQGYLLALKANRVKQFAGYVGISLAVVVLLWAATVYSRHHTQGVTANDPYAYTQMAVDIAQRGSPTHRFPLFPTVSHLGISWWPVVHYGYQVRVPPLRGDGTTATDWPPGWPAILSMGYLVLGERGLYLVNPVIGLLSLGALVALVAEVLHDRPRGERLLAGSFAAFCLATSYEQIDRLLVPMADASAQLFTTLTLILLLRGMRTRHRLYAVLAGLCFGWAYLVRHTQLVLGVCVVAALLCLAGRALTRRQRWEFVGLFGIVALVVAIPDLLYHQFVFGHFLRPESTELYLFSLAHVFSTGRLIWQRGLSGNEFGYLAPLVAYGAFRMFRSRRGLFLVLLTAVLGILAVHLPYAALRLRDLLSAFPILLAWAGYGVADLWNRIAPKESCASYTRYALGTSVFMAILLLPVLRTWPILPRPWGTYVASFGYVTAEQRLGFDALAQRTVEPCVVGSSLNGGPIDLYAGRQAFRPAFWTADEFDVFLEHMFQEGTAVYLLDDGEDLQANLEHARSHYRVSATAHLTVPLFGDPQRISSTLYRIEPRGGLSP